MQVLSFGTDAVPPADRLTLFRRGATDYQVDAIGDPLAFSVNWRLLALGEINIVDARISPVRYVRTPAQIESDGMDRVSVLYLHEGRVTGTVDGEPADIRPGDAIIVDLTRPIDVTCAPNSYTLLTIPRYLIEEVLPKPHFAGTVAASAALALAFEQVAYLLDHADAIADESAIFHARAVRDMAAVAVLPAYRTTQAIDASAPLLRQVCEIIDADLLDAPDEAAIARRLGTSSGAVRDVLYRVGGIGQLVERRRLLAAYRQLSDPSQSDSISDIAVRCGFANLPGFSRRFRQTFHCAPRDVRTQRLGRLPRWAGAYHVESHYGALMAA